MLTIGMAVEISLQGLDGIGALSLRPVDGVNLMFGFQLMFRVRMLGKIIEQGLLRSAHYGIVPLIVDSFDSIQTRCDGVDMFLRSVLIVVEVRLKHNGVVALHGKLVCLLFLRCLGVVVEIKADSTDDERKDQSHDQWRVALLLLWFVVA